MKAGEANLLEFLQCKGKGQYIVPIFQRPYSWTLSECMQLWKDVTRIAEDKTSPAHFMGSVVYISEGLYRPTGIPELLLIDGQQRLATVTLLLAALRGHISEGNAGTELSREKIDDYYLFNKYGQDGQKYRLVLTKGDNETLVSILENRELPRNHSTRLTENYKYFNSVISESELDPETVFEGLGKLMIVDITLSKDYDDAQLIYESLNSTGLDLTQTDLIRNYILMNLDLERQSKLYNDYWYPMEQDFGGGEGADDINRFMRDYLTLKTGAIPNVDEVYVAFKDYAWKLRTSDIESLVDDVRSFSKHFVRIAFARSDDEEIKHLLTRIGELNVDVSFPFLMEAMDDRQNGRISREEFIEILKLVESYVFRRAICGIPTNSLNKTFAGLARLIDKSKYVESLKAAFILMDSYRRFPKDVEFMQSLVTREVYRLRGVEYLLGSLENYDRKEKINVSEFTVEHIMPQNPKLSNEWQNELGSDWQRVQTTYLHRIGNLTLTGYNPELSDRAFVEKRDMKGGFKDSPVRLNSSLRGLEHWNEGEIQKRSNELASLAAKIWSYPLLPEEQVEKYRPKKGPEAKGGPEFRAERYRLRHEFWQQLLEKASARGFTCMEGQKPSQYYSMGYVSSMKRVYFDFFVHVSRTAEIDLSIYTLDIDLNKRLFDYLLLRKEHIEKEVGSPLVWRRQDSMRGSRIIWEVGGSGVKEGSDKWSDTQNIMLDSMQRFTAVLEPELKAFMDQNRLG